MEEQVLRPSPSSARYLSSRSPSSPTLRRMGRMGNKAVAPRGA